MSRTRELDLLTQSTLVYPQALSEALIGPRHRPVERPDVDLKRLRNLAKSPLAYTPERVPQET
jgi:hypothetical protein